MTLASTGLGHELYHLLNLQATLTIVTFFAATAVFILYIKQKSDLKKDAAGIVYREIERAESKIPEVKEVLKAIRNNEVPASVRVMPVDSWTKYQHVLTSRLSLDVAGRIEKYYSNCRLLDTVLKHVDEAFEKNEQQVRINGFRINTNLTYEATEKQKDNPNNLPAITTSNQKIWQAVQSRRIRFNNTPQQYSYIPVKSANDVDKYLGLLKEKPTKGDIGRYLKVASKSWLRRTLFTTNEWIAGKR